MTKTDIITTLIESLTKIQSTPRPAVDCSEAGNRRIMNKAVDFVHTSNLEETDRKQVIQAIHLEANPSGYYYADNGVKAGLKNLRAVLASKTNKVQTRVEELHESVNIEENEQASTQDALGLNRRNLQNLVSDGSIFYVEFIKRTTGERRMMRCRTGVTKYLKGGKQAYNAASKGLLSVFDMNAKGYRSILVEAIQALKINGQSFNFVGV